MQTMKSCCEDGAQVLPYILLNSGESAHNHIFMLWWPISQKKPENCLLLYLTMLIYKDGQCFHRKSQHWS